MNIYKLDIQNQLLHTVCYIFLTLLSIGCIPKDTFDFDEALITVDETEVVFPMAKAELRIIDLINKKDTGNIVYGIQEERGRQISFFYTDTLFSDHISDVVQVGTRAFNETFSLPSLALPDINTNTNIILGNILAGNPVDGTTPFPPFTFPFPITDQIALSNSNDFSFIDPSGGTLEVTISNTTESDLAFTLELENIGNVVFNIPTNNTETQTINLAGTTINNQITYTIANLSGPGSLGTLNYDDGLDIQFNFNNLTYQQAGIRFTEPIISNQQFIFNIDINNIEFYRLLLKTGKFNYNISNSLANGLDITYTLNLPDFIRNGQSITESLNVITPNGAVGSIELEDADVDLTNYTPAHSCFILDLTLSITPDNQIYIFNSNEVFNAHFEISNFTYQIFEGLIPQQTINLGRDTLRIGIFENTLNGGDFQLSDVDMSITVENGYGKEIGVSLSNPRFQNLDAIRSSLIVTPNPLIAMPATLNGNQIQPGNSDFMLTNVFDSFSIYPNLFYYDAFAVLGSNSTNASTVFTDESALRVITNITIPFRGRANDISGQSTFELNLSNIYDAIDSITESSLRIYANNAIPVDLKLQIFLLNISGVIEDSLFSEDLPVVAASQTNDQGITIANTILTIDVDIDLKDLLNSNQIQIRLRGLHENTNQEEFIFFDDDIIELKLGLKIKGNYTETINTN